ncbi:unnamed protein product [Clonostachys rhizophaga]|uniref:Uncharacterized protein n=1 Tax=Clonostachys rhizophaga TaxID=160324 RepID=A0A9N9VTY3_9HYPO|nr:unnamed protein product [Clonostachys rhizophaga]
MASPTGSRIGYYMDGSSAVPIYCPNGKAFGITDQLGRCDITRAATAIECLSGGIPDGYVLEIYVFATYGYSVTITQSQYCPSSAPCVTVTLHENMETSASSFTMFQCRGSIQLPRGVTEVFMSIPSTVAITTNTENVRQQTTRGRDISSLAPTSRSTASAPGQTENAVQGGGTNPGIIAGAVVGSVVGLGLIITALVFAFLLGRRRASGNGSSGGRKDDGDILGPLPLKETMTTPELQANKTTAIFTQFSSPLELAADARANGPRTELPECGRPEPPELMADSRGAGPGSELPVTPSSHQWPTPGTEPSRYEMEGSYRPSQAP